jgi:malonyl-CoA decarboxylase
MEFELRHLLESWFNLGFLQLRRITWESPAALLEKIVTYEAVHEFTHWKDLKRRLESDRTCFAFIHPAMPNEPIIFVQVALVQGVCGSIQRLLDPSAPELIPHRADTAIFYSITNAQRGLRGIPFGNLLIKQVAAQLRSEVPSLETFCTLSPIPRFRKDYLEPALADSSLDQHYTTTEDQLLRKATDARSASSAVRRLLDRPDWHEDPATADALRPGLLRAARAYLGEEEHRGRAACPVAHFHASNGAMLARINWLGDTSSKGLMQSAGIMVNYLYDTEKFEEHQNEYARTGKLPVGEEVMGL